MERYNSSFQNKPNSSFKVSQLERKWQQILEEERRSILRNKKLLEDFDHVDQQSKVFSKKSDSLKQAKHTFELYVSSVYPKWTKDVKQLQQAKKRTLGKDGEHSSNLTDKDYNKQKNPGYSLHDTVTSHSARANPASSSTPYRNSIDFEEHERLQPAGRNGFNENDDHLRYSGRYSFYESKPFDNLMSRLNEDRSRSWIKPEDTSYGVHHHDDQRYSPSRQSWPWRNTRHSYQDQHSYMFDPYGVIDPRMRNGRAGFSGNVHEYPGPQFRSYDDSTSEARTFQEFHRGPRNDRYGGPMERSSSTDLRRDQSYSETYQDHHQDERQRDTGSYQVERQRDTGGYQDGRQQRNTDGHQYERRDTATGHQDGRQQRSTATGDHDRRQQDIDGHQDGRHRDTGDHEGGRHRDTGDHEDRRQRHTVTGHQDDRRRDINDPEGGRHRHTSDHEGGRQRDSDDSMKSQNVQSYHAGCGISKTSSEEKLMKERLDHHVDLKRSPELKDMVDINHEVNQDTSNFENPVRGRTGNGDVSEHRENRKTSAKKRGSRDRSVEKPSRVEVYDERIKSGDGSFDQSSGGINSKEEESASLDKQSGGNEMRKKPHDIGSKEMDNTESISLPTIHKFEGDIREIYSELSDTEQVSGSAGDVVSEPGHAGLPKTDEVDTTEQRKSLQESDHIKTDDDEGTEVVGAIFGKLPNREALAKEDGKTSVMDDLLGDDASDFEVSDSEISEEVPNGNLLDEAGQTEIPKKILQKTDVPENAELETKSKFVNPEAVNQPDLTKTVLSSSNDHLSSEEVVKKHEWKTPARNELSSQNNSSEDFNELIESEKRNDYEGRDLNSEDSLQQQRSSKDNISSEAAPVEDTKTKRLVIDEKTFLVLLQVVDDDIEVSFSTELLYRNYDCSVEKREEVLRAVESGESLEQFDAAVTSMILLDQLPYLVRASGNGCLISAEVLSEQKKCLTEKDFRDTIPASLISLWKSLFLHFLKLMQNNVMNSEKIAEIFAPCLVSSDCTSTEKAVSFLARIVSNSQEAYDKDTQSKEEQSGHDQEQESEDEKSKSGLLEELSFSSEESNSQPVYNEDKNNRKRTANKIENTGTVSYSEDFEEEKSVRLTESDAYQRMLSSIKVSDEEEDIEEDLLGEGTMSEANTTGPTKQDNHPAQKQPEQPLPHSSNILTNSVKTKSKPKLSLFSSGERDEFGDSFGNDGEGILTSSWKSSEMSLSLPLSPDMDTGGYLPTASGEMKGKDGKETDKGVITETKAKRQESNTKSRIQAGFWNHSDSESEVDLQVSHGANNDNDDDDFDFYS